MSAFSLKMAAIRELLRARMNAVRDDLSSTGSDISEDRWSTTQLQNSLPPSVTSSSSLSSSSSNDAENMATVLLGFMDILLPPLRTMVRNSMEVYFHQHQWQSLREDPIKKSRLNFRRNITAVGPDELAFLFLDPNDQCNNEGMNVGDCEDIRVLLKIIVKAGCFTDEESQLAKKLKEYRNHAAHQTHFSKESKKIILDDILAMLEMMKSNHGIDTTSYQRKQKQLRKFGARHYLKKNKNQNQLSSLRSSVSSSSDVDGTLVANLIDCTLTDVRREERENKRSAIQTANQWAALNVEKPMLVTHQYIFKSNKGKRANLDSLLRTSKQKHSKELFVGKNFKMMSVNKFAEGSSRVAYRGQFHGPQTNPWFDDNPEVVLKKSFKLGQNTTEIIKTRYFSSVLVDRFNPIVSKRTSLKITLLDLLVLRDEDMTLEPYIDHTSYTKW